MVKSITDILLILSSKEAKKKYAELISRARGRKLPRGTYTEKHHRVPRAIYGKDVSPDVVNSKENLVKLTLAEHFEAHQLLECMTRGTKYHDAALHAIWGMCIMNDPEHLIISPREYEFYRAKFIETQKGENHPLYGKKRPELSERMKGENHPMFGKKRPDLSKINSERTGENHPMYGKHHSAETRRKLSEANKGQIPWNIKDYIVISPDGEKQQIRNLHQFCKDNNLHNGNMCCVAQGKRKQHKGWRCYYENKSYTRNRKIIKT